MGDYLQDRFEDVMSKSLHEELTILKAQLGQVLASNVGDSAPNLLTSGEEARSTTVPLEVDLRPLGMRHLVGQVRRNGAPLELDSVIVKRFDESTGSRDDVEAATVQQETAASLVVIELETDALVPDTIFAAEVIVGGITGEHLVTVD